MVATIGVISRKEMKKEQRTKDPSDTAVSSWLPLWRPSLSHLDCWAPTGVCVLVFLVDSLVTVTIVPVLQMWLRMRGVYNAQKCLKQCWAIMRPQNMVVIILQCKGCTNLHIWLILPKCLTCRLLPRCLGSPHLYSMLWSLYTPFSFLPEHLHLSTPTFHFNH